jgi:hypothetical protein
MQFGDAPFFAGSLLQGGIRVNAQSAGNLADREAGNNQSPESAPIDINFVGH